MKKIDLFIKEKLLFGNFFFKKIYFFFNKYKSLFISKKSSYSQGSMDLVLLDVFKNINNGIYIDVGCQHPIKNNNTYLLHKKGWSGVNIDLDKHNIEIFDYNRPNDINLECAVSDKIEEVDLYFYHVKSPINTLNKSVSDYQAANVNKIIKITTDTLNNVLEKTTYSNKKIDLLTIDVEGNELKVLKGLDLNKFSPFLIVVEFLDLDSKKFEINYNNLNNVLKSELYIYLLSKNYKLVNWVNGDLVFVKA